MAEWSIVNLHETADLRLDAEYYRPHLLLAEHTLEEKGWHTAPLGNLIKSGYRVVYENTEILDEKYDPQKHVYFLQAADILNAYPAINQDSMGWVSIEDWKRYSKGRIKRGEILVEVKGKAEKVVLVPNDFPENVLVTGTLYKMLIDDEKVNPFYVFVYLLSRLGRDFRDRGKTNTLISYVNKSDLYSISVPLAPDTIQDQIAQKYEQSFAAFELAKSLYSNAENEIISTLGIRIPSPPDFHAYTANFSLIEQSQRLDAEYFNPQKQEVLTSLLNFDSKPLSYYFKSVREAFQPEYAPSKVVRNYDLPDALRFYLDDDIETTLASEIGSTKRRFEYNDLVVSRLRSYLREIAIVKSKGEPDCVGSSEFIVLRQRNQLLSPELLLVYLRSPYVQTVLKWSQKGSNHPRFDEKDLLNIPIPDALLSVQTSVTHIIQEAIVSYREANNLLSNAKQFLTQTIFDRSE